VPDSHLAFELSGRRTVLRRALAVAPLRLLTPRNHGSAAWAYTTTLGGGLVGGDEIRLRATVGRGARALLSSQGATRLYRSARASVTSLDADLEEGALLALLPDPVSGFAGSRSEQRTCIQLAPGASLAFAELITAGRAARDGRWALSRYSSSLTVRRAGLAAAEGRLLCADALLLDAAHGPLAERMGRFDCLATVLLLGPLLVPAARAALASIGAAPVARGAPLVAAASPLEDGALVRLAAVSVEAAVAFVRALLSDLPGLLGDDPFARRA
jgi:urease accessory protein